MTTHHDRIELRVNVGAVKEEGVSWEMAYGTQPAHCGPKLYKCIPLC
jgi:hypothetical protein